MAAEKEKRLSPLPKPVQVQVRVGDPNRVTITDTEGKPMPTKNLPAWAKITLRVRYGINIPNKEGEKS